MRISSLIAASLLSVVLIARPANAQQHIGVVRVIEVLSKVQEREKQAQAEVARKNDAQAERDALVREIQNLGGQADQLKRGSAQQLQVLEQIQEKKDAYEVWAKQKERLLAKVAKEELRLMMQHVVDATQQIATERHLDLVVNDTAPEITVRDEQLTVDQFASVIAQQPIVFASKNIDVTQEVIARVDQLYSKMPGPSSPKK